MLGDHKAIATIAVKDVARAREFYEKKLGLKPGPESPDGTAVYEAGPQTILVYHSEYAGTNQATAVTWDAGSDVDSIVKTLRENGVTFEHYDFPHTRREGDLHIHGGMKMAWFKDPDGNIHGVMGR